LHYQIDPNIKAYDILQAFTKIPYQIMSKVFVKLKEWVSLISLWWVINIK